MLSIPLSYAESLLAPIPAHLLTRLHCKQYNAKNRPSHNKRQRSDANEKIDSMINDAGSINDASLHHADKNVNTLATHIQE